MKWLALLLVVWSGAVFAQSCPGADDEPAMKVKTAAGPSLVICGYEDHDSPAPKGAQAFSEFSVYASGGGIKESAKVFSSEAGDTYWAKGDAKGLDLQEVWYFADKPQPAVGHRIDCTADACTAAPARCVLKLKRNPFPKALARFQKAAGQLGDDGEDILDQIWGQALAGDAAALKFYASRPVLDPSLNEIYDSNQKKLKQAQELKCQPSK